MSRIKEMVAAWLVPHVELRTRYDELERLWKERGLTIYALHTSIAAHKKENAALRGLLSKAKQELAKANAPKPPTLTVIEGGDA